jgi:hypothetical protein
MYVCIYITKAKKEAEVRLKAIAEQEAKLASELEAANPTVLSADVKVETDGKDIYIYIYKYINTYICIYIYINIYIYICIYIYI